MSPTELLIQGDYFGIPPKGHRGKKDYKTIGVRFLRGSNLAKLYTYRVRKGAKLHLGQEVVVPTDPDKQGYDTNTIAVVVRVDKEPQDLGPYNYKFVVGTVNQL